jgi:hypothetical protein
MFNNSKFDSEMDQTNEFNLLSTDTNRKKKGNHFFQSQPPPMHIPVLDNTG